MPPILSFSLVTLEANISLTEFPERLGEALGIPAFAGGILAMFILLFASFALLLSLTRKRPPNLAVLLMGFMVMIFSVAVGWCPVYVLVMLILGLSVMYGKTILGIFRRGDGD